MPVTPHVAIRVEGARNVHISDVRFSNPAGGAVAVSNAENVTLQRLEVLSDINQIKPFLGPEFKPISPEVLQQAIRIAQTDRSEDAPSRISQIVGWISPAESALALAERLIEIVNAAIKSAGV